MIKQFFTDIELDPKEMLSEKLHSLVNDAEDELQTEYIEVVQVIKHNAQQYTVLLNADILSQEEEAEE